MDDSAKNDENELSYYVLWRSDQTEIGRFIGIGADLDFILSMILFKKLKLTFSNRFVLFGKMSIGNKINKLMTILKNSKDKSHLEEFESIKMQLEDFVKVRNTLAHGIMIGRIKHELVFLITDSSSFEDSDTIILKYRRIRIDKLAFYKQRGILLVKHLSLIFGVQMPHEAAQWLYQAQKDPNL